MLETLIQKQHRAGRVLAILRKTYPRAKIALKYGNNIQLLVAVILSAQCTDKKVNEVTGTLFQKYKTASNFASANVKTFEQEIRSTGFYRAKTKNIIAAAKIIEKDFGGKLPDTMENMLKLPGVARKTAYRIHRNILAGMPILNSPIERSGFLFSTAWVSLSGARCIMEVRAPLEVLRIKI